MKKNLISALNSALILVFAGIFVSTLFFSCATTKPALNSGRAENFYQEKNYFLAEIDISSPEIEIKTYPKQEGFHKPVSVKKFARKNGCFAAINANPFDESSRLNPLFSRRKPIGIYIDGFKEFSAPEKKYAAVAFFKEETGYSAKIYDSQAEIPGKQAEFAFGGFWTILRGEEIFSFKEIKDFRSAIGISEDGRKIYLFCGKKLSFNDCAQILKSKNVFSAMQFDGGSSSQLYFSGKNRQKTAAARLPSVILGFSTVSSKE